MGPEHLKAAELAESLPLDAEPGCGSSSDGKGSGSSDCEEEGNDSAAPQHPVSPEGNWALGCDPPDDALEVMEQAGEQQQQEQQLEQQKQQV
ncbi:hypothetical protein HaLaN_20217 [Haematococcus lacustris]|uniref:Uncharacterized protein n=1 Tax=Haematococcus lacustris TaxID=44745 RepID=A0A699ZSJ1_HAELA|nr:hypothetical protein HaLaN_20217 [Haematococcus lacustris]